MPISIAIAQGVSFEFPNGRKIFNNLNFSLLSRTTALVGPNGVGKTCLARLISGELEPTRGSLKRNFPVVFFMQRQDPPDQTAQEWLDQHYKWCLSGEKILKNVNRHTLCKDLSGGQWMRVRLACALSQDSFLILDEPTNDLDREGREILLDFLRKHKRGVLLISHDRECLSLCTDVLELSNQGLTKFGRSWDEYEKFRAHERETLRHSLDVAKRDHKKSLKERHQQILQQEKRNRRGVEAAARGGMPKIMIGGLKRKAQVTTGKIDASTLQKTNQKVQEAHEAFQALKIDPVMYADLIGETIPSQKLIAEAVNFNIRFKNWIYPMDMNFRWQGNIRIALKGSNGSGKSTLLKALMGHKFNTRGELRYNKLNVLYIDQQCELLDNSKNILENVRANGALDESETRQRLAKFLFMKDDVFQKVNTLSGGERLRAALACGLLGSQKPELLILDEPTNNLDLPNIEFLENLISQFRGAVIIISHDEIFLKKCGIKNELVL